MHIEFLSPIFKDSGKKELLNFINFFTFHRVDFYLTKK